MPHWNPIGHDGRAWWFEYSFSSGAWATALAFRTPDGIAVISPPKVDDPTVLDELGTHGPITALIANNAFHHLGQTTWRAHFPAAQSYGPPGGLAALKKKHPDIPWRDVAELTLNPGCSIADPPGFRTGEVFASISTDAGTVWYTGDLLSNIHRTPGPPVQWLFTWTGSAPGFKLFKPCVWFFVKDRPALRAWYEARLASDPPSIIVPAHGPAYAPTSLADEVRDRLKGL